MSCLFIFKFNISRIFWSYKLPLLEIICDNGTWTHGQSEEHTLVWSFQCLLHVNISQKPGNCFYSWTSMHWYHWMGEKWLSVHWMKAVKLARKTDSDQRCVPKWYQNISAVRKKSTRFLEEIKLWRRWLPVISLSLLVWPRNKMLKSPSETSRFSK